MAGGFDGDVVVTADGTLGFGGTTGFCILDGFGGRGGRFWSPVVCLLIGLYVAGECVSMMVSICCKHVLMDDKIDACCFGLEIMAIRNARLGFSDITHFTVFTAFTRMYKFDFI